MNLAIESARTAASVPSGAVIVRRATGECFAIGANRSAENPIFHWEIDAVIRCAADLPLPELSATLSPNGRMSGDSLG